MSRTRINQPINAQAGDRRQAVAALGVLPSTPARQGRPLNDNDKRPYYLDCFSAWFHNHSNGTAGMLRKVRHRVLQCERCGKQWETTPDPDWVIRRVKRVPEVMQRIRPTDNPWVWECPEKSRHDGSTYRIEFDKDVNRWTCTCRDFRDHQENFWGGCKHVRAVQKNIAMFIADHEHTPESTAHQMVEQETKPEIPLPEGETPPKGSPLLASLSDQLPTGRPISGNGWRCTLLTRNENGVVFLEVQGVVHSEEEEAVWEEFRQKKFEVSPDCVWINIANQMGSEVAA